MILAKSKPNVAHGYLGLGIVLAISKQDDGHKLYYVYTEEKGYPMQYDANDLDILGKDTPDDWITVKYSDYAVSSFREWADDEYFFGHVLDDYDLEATNRAQSTLDNKLSEYLNDYAITKYGSINAAKEHILRKRYEEKFKLHKERGYEKPEELEVTNDILERVPLDINDLYEA